MIRVSNKRNNKQKASKDKLISKFRSKLNAIRFLLKISSKKHLLSASQVSSLTIILVSSVEGPFVPLMI